MRMMTTIVIRIYNTHTQNIYIYLCNEGDDAGGGAGGAGDGAGDGGDDDGDDDDDHEYQYQFGFTKTDSMT